MPTSYPTPFSTLTQNNPSAHWDLQLTFYCPSPSHPPCPQFPSYSVYTLSLLEDVFLLSPLSFKPPIPPPSSSFSSEDSASYSYLSGHQSISSSSLWTLNIGGSWTFSLTTFTSQNHSSRIMVFITQIELSVFTVYMKTVVRKEQYKVILLTR